MGTNLISSKDNQIYKKVLKLKKGDATKSLFLVEGNDLVSEAFKANLLKEVIYLDEYKYKNEYTNIPFYSFKRNLFREISSFQSLSNVIGICEKKYNEITGDKIIYLDNIQDPGNVGTIIRSALSFNYSSLVLSLDSVSLYNSKVIQASKGAIFHLNIVRDDLINIKNKGYNIYLTTLDGKDERKIDKLKKPFVLVFGNEGRGIKEKYLSLGEKLKIEMSGIDSLNVACAASIFMYRFKD